MSRTMAETEFLTTFAFNRQLLLLRTMATVLLLNSVF
jgi:hypothetical protein